MSSILEEFDADRYEEDLKQIYREEGNRNQNRY